VSMIIAVEPTLASVQRAGRFAPAGNDKNPSLTRSVRLQEAPGGFEPPVEVLQTSALPLGYGALKRGSQHPIGHGEGLARVRSLGAGRWTKRAKPSHVLELPTTDSSAGLIGPVGAHEVFRKDHLKNQMHPE